MAKKGHCVTVTITSESDGELNQEVICKEYAGTAEELIYKNHAIADAVIEGVNNCMKRLSAEYLAGNQPGAQGQGQSVVR